MSLLRVLRLVVTIAALALPAALSGAVPSADPDAEKGRFLTGQLLVASPSMGDPRFRETVIVMVRHNRDGAMGLVINRRAGERPLARLLEGHGGGADVSGSVPVYVGGPVQLEHGFVLHGGDYRRSGTLDIGPGVAMTASREIVRDIAGKTGPNKFLLIFGYAGWGPGQLEGELAANAWYTAPLDPALVFDLERDKVWERAAERRTRDL